MVEQEIESGRRQGNDTFPGSVATLESKVGAWAPHEKAILTWIPAPLWPSWNLSFFSMTRTGTSFLRRVRAATRPDGPLPTYGENTD